MIIKRKTRNLAVRLTEEQYLLLQRLSAIQGARSISDFARDCLCSESASSARGGAGGLAPTLEAISRDLASMCRELEKVKALVGEPERARL